MDDPNFCIRQNLPKVYSIIGLNTIWAKTIINTDTLFGTKVKACVFGREKSVDIDTKADLSIARAIMEYNSKK